MEVIAVFMVVAYVYRLLRRWKKTRLVVAILLSLSPLVVLAVFRVTGMTHVAATRYAIYLTCNFFVTSAAIITWDNVDQQLKEAPSTADQQI